MRRPRPLPRRLRAWLRREQWWQSPALGLGRAPVDHVVIIDGSLSSLAEGYETNAGLLYKLLRSGTPQRRLSLRYERGIQLPSWSSLRDIIEGRGINRQIRRVYGALASRYRPGDRIFLFGYSRGAYAARSLAGVIARVGLLRAECATERHIQIAYRHYERGQSPVADKFRRAYCHDAVDVEMIGAWDTVKALGLRVPLLWRFTQPAQGFHDHQLGPHIRHAYHALALDETRLAFSPVLWEGTEAFPGTVEQMWFPGVHGDVGGQISGKSAARPRSNIALVWMLEKAEQRGLPLPEGWRARFPCDADAPSVGAWSGCGPIFLSRQRRTVGQDPSERLHPTAQERSSAGKATPSALLKRLAAWRGSAEGL